MIWELIGTGSENATTKETLAAILHTDVRGVRLQVARERKAGYPIISGTERPGFYRPSCRAEIERFCRSMSHRASETFQVANSLRQYLDGLDGQSCLWEEDDRDGVARNTPVNP